MKRPRQQLPSVRIVFRYDDCSAVSSLELEERFIRSFADCGAQVTMGIVPFQTTGDPHDPAPRATLELPPAKIALLQQGVQQGAVEAALHGYNHRTRAAGANSEVAGLPLDEQRTRIRAGQHELQRRLGTPVTTFIPPWNAYDAATLRVLEECGFDCVCASVRGPFPRRPRLRFLPASCWLQGLSETLQAVRAVGHMAPVLVIMLHDFDFIESGRSEAWLTLDQFDRTLRRLRADPRVQLLSVRQACQQGIVPQDETLAAQQLWRSWTRGLPWRVRHILEDQVIWARGPAARSLPLALYYQACVSGRRLYGDLVPALGRRLGKLIRGQGARALPQVAAASVGSDSPMVTP